MFLAQIHGSSNLSQIREELRLFFVRLRPPLIVAAVFLALCRSLCTMCWISFSCISYPASTTHSHTHTDTLICTVTHKHNHRQRCTLLCNFFLHALVFCCLAKLSYFFFLIGLNHKHYFTFSQNFISFSLNLVHRESHFTHSLSCNHHLQRAGKSP